jgi:hypothetical protein
MTSIEMFPNLKTSGGGLVGEDSNEQAGTEASRGVGTSEGGGTDGEERSGATAGKLPARQAAMAAVSQEGRKRTGA